MTVKPKLISSVFLFLPVSRYYPVATQFQSDVSSKAAIGIELGYYHSCALFEGGLVRCFGKGGSGQLGYRGTSKPNTRIF